MTKNLFTIRSVLLRKDCLTKRYSRILHISLRVTTCQQHFTCRNTSVLDLIFISDDYTMANRPKGYGMSAEVQRKVGGKLSMSYI